MPEERPNPPRNDEGRRRYFRRRSNSTRKPNHEESPRPQASREQPNREQSNREQPNREQPANKRRGGERPNNQMERAERVLRVGKRRRRSRSRANQPPTGKNETPVVESALDNSDYVAPRSVFIYTHVIRPGAWDNFEFRAETFSSVGRQLDDYQIDLSILYTDGPDGGTARPAAPLPPPDADLFEDD